jgi:hypothetical protein
MTRQKGEGIDRVLAASTSYPILSYPILSYAAVPPDLTVYRCRSCAMRAKTEVSVVGETPWKGKEGGGVGGGGGGGVWH